MLRKTIATLASYIPQIHCGSDTLHLVIHPDCDTAYTTLTALNHLAAKLHPYTTLIIPSHVDFQRPAAPNVARWALANTHSVQSTQEYEKIYTALPLKTEIILSGGFFGVCHLAWFKRLLHKAIRQNPIVFHFYTESIFPINATQSPLENNYFRLLENPFRFFVNPQFPPEAQAKAAKEFQQSDLPYKTGVPSAVFLNDTLLWRNTDEPVVILNYWTNKGSPFF